VGGLARPYLPRLAALTVLDRLGVHALEALPVIAFGAPADVPFVLTGTYSYRLLANFTPAATYLVDLAKVARPITLLAGEKDEVFVAEQYAPLLKPHRPDIAVAILPGVGHAGIIIDPEALAAAVAAVGDGPPVRGRPLDRRL
jgi:pimeloyl-ACP methyl ester carboxylesterase